MRKVEDKSNTKDGCEISFLVVSCHFVRYVKADRTRL